MCPGLCSLFPRKRRSDVSESCNAARVVGKRPICGVEIRFGLIAYLRYAHGHSPNPALQLLRSTAWMQECRERNPACEGEIISLKQQESPALAGFFLACPLPQNLLSFPRKRESCDGVEMSGMYRS